MSSGLLILDIPDFPNYQISEHGNVYNKKSGRELIPCVNSRGYMRFICINNGEKKELTLHRILALLFIPNPFNKEQVDHIDRNKLNNKLENLRWVNASENATNTGIFKNNKSGFKGICHKKNKNGTEYWRCNIMKNHENLEKLFPYNFKGLVRAIVWRLNKEIELHVIE